MRSRGVRRSWKGLADALARGLAKPVLALAARLRRERPEAAPSRGERLLADVALTFRLSPLFVVACLASAVLALTLPGPSIRRGLLPVLFAALPLFLADVPTRDVRSGATGLVFAAPGTREGYVPWKLASALVASLALTGLPALGLALSREKPAAVSVLVATLAAAAFAVLLGVASGTPKTFLAVFLALWYLALNDKGASPGLDLFGFWSTATPRVHASWIAASLAAVGLAHAFHRTRLARNG